MIIPVLSIKLLRVERILFNINNNKISNKSNCKIIRNPNPIIVG